MGSAIAAGDADIFSPRILVVDDIETNRSILARLLSRRGFIVIEARSGAMAIDLVQDLPPNLVLLDVRMPDLSGVETLQELRRSHDAADLPVIMVTAEENPEIIAECLAAGANDYVTKPVQWAILQARIATHLGLHRAHAQLLRDRDRLRDVLSLRTEESIEQVLADRMHREAEGERIETH